MGALVATVPVGLTKRSPPHASHGYRKGLLLGSASMIVRKHMIDELVHANLRDGLHQTYRRMRERDIRHMPVIDDDGRLVGIISERDVLRPNFVDTEPNTSGAFVLDNKVRVEEAMTPNPITLHTDDGLGKALDLFLKHKFGALPVVDENETLVGILSTIDLLQVLKDQLG